VFELVAIADALNGTEAATARDARGAASP